MCNDYVTVCSTSQGFYLVKAGSMIKTLWPETFNLKGYQPFQGEGALAIGTQVSAQYKGAFCEAKVRSVDKQVKCRVTFKMGLGSTTISDKDIKTDKPLVQGATVLARHPDKQEYLEATVKEIKVRISNRTASLILHSRR